MLTHWELEHYRQLYRNQIDRLVETLTVRLLPTFDSVHAEVEALQRKHPANPSCPCASERSCVSPSPPVRQQLPDPTLRLRRQAGEDILQIGEGLVPVEARRLDQAHDRRRPLAGAQRAGKEPVLAVMLNST